MRAQAQRRHHRTQEALWATIVERRCQQDSEHVNRDAFAAIHMQVSRWSSFTAPHYLLVRAASVCHGKQERVFGVSPGFYHKEEELDVTYCFAKEMLQALHQPCAVRNATRGDAMVYHHQIRVDGG